jgi:pimeloyl-ACP methyl ester carboxylesterase
MPTGRTTSGSWIALGLALALAGPADARAGEGSRTAGGKIPVVFVPGTSGSILKFHDGSVYWLDSTSVLPGRIIRGSLNPSGGEEGVETMTVGGILDAVKFALPADVTAELARFQMLPWVGKAPDRLPIYSHLSEWGVEKFGPKGWYEVSYDWRKGAGAEASARIDAVVTRAMAENDGRKVVLVAHSLGGLVCRDYIAGAGRGKVDALVSVGTPWLGALKTARALAWGYNFGAGFTSRHTPFVPDLHWYVNNPQDAGNPLQVTPPLRVTFLSNQDTGSLARNFPCVFQQLPAGDFMDSYGKSVIFGLTPDQASDRLRRYNPGLYDAAVAWRREHLKADNFGVAHVAIAGTCDPSGDPGDFQDMQMAIPESLVAEVPGLIELANRQAINSRREILARINRRGVPIYLDEFLATDTGVAFGDGTSALLSATCGAIRRDGGAIDVSRAEKFLGPGVKVRVVQLERPYSHGSMVDDLGVRQEILRAVEDRREAAGLPADPRASEVGIMTLRLSTRAETIPSILPERIMLRVAGTDFFTNYALAEGRSFPTDFVRTGADAYYYYHRPQVIDTATGRLRPLRNADLAGTKLTLTKGGIFNWNCRGVRLLIDVHPVIDRTDPFTLSFSNPSIAITIEGVR